MLSRAYEASAEVHHQQHLQGNPGLAVLSFAHESAAGVWPLLAVVGSFVLCGVSSASFDYLHLERGHCIQHLTLSYAPDPIGSQHAAGTMHSNTQRACRVA